MLVNYFVRIGMLEGKMAELVGQSEANPITIDAIIVVIDRRLTGVEIRWVYGKPNRKNGSYEPGSEAQGHGEMAFWMKGEYLQFPRQLEGRAVMHCAFEILYWSGLRLGEMLALTPSHVEFMRGAIMVRRTLSRSNEGYVATQSKAPCSRRIADVIDNLSGSVHVGDSFVDKLHWLAGLLVAFACYGEKDFDAVERITSLEREQKTAE